MPREEHPRIRRKTELFYNLLCTQEPREYKCTCARARARHLRVDERRPIDACPTRDCLMNTESLSLPQGAQNDEKDDDVAADAEETPAS
eukprot:8744083-Alexandrium_andersonii.AAC.1